MSNQYIRRKFCDKCGSKTHEATVRGSFDKETGEPNTRDICTNQKCEVWCDFYNKHTFSIYGFGATCKNCGYDRNNY